MDVSIRILQSRGERKKTPGKRTVRKKKTKEAAKAHNRKNNDYTKVSE